MSDAAAVVTTQFSNAQAFTTTAFAASMEMINRLSVSFPEVDFTAILNAMNGMLTGDIGVPVSQIVSFETARDASELNNLKSRRAIDLNRHFWSSPSGIVGSLDAEIDLFYNNKRLDKPRDVRIQVQSLSIQQLDFALKNIMELGLSRAGLEVKALETGATIAAQLTASAAASAHAQAAISSSDSVRISTNTSTNVNVGKTTSTSTNNSTNVSTTEGHNTTINTGVNNLVETLQATNRNRVSSARVVNDLIAQTTERTTSNKSTEEFGTVNSASSSRSDRTANETASGVDRGVSMNTGTSTSTHNSTTSSVGDETTTGA